MSSSNIHHLYLNHHRWLYRWLQGKLGHEGDAADIAQDTFLRMMHAFNGSNNPHAEDRIQEPRAYLTVVAKRLVANLYRRRALEQAYLETLTHLPESSKPSPEQQLLILETLQQIDSMLDGLAKPVKDAFLLAQLDGLSYAQIAQQLALSERTVKRYMVKAMATCIMLIP